MGQQQLILLVLATVIVGIAIVVGIRAFNENSIKANSDALVQDMVRMANDAQAWKQKPAPFGGQAEGAAKVDPTDFTGADLAGLGYEEDANNNYTNLNGSYEVALNGTTLLIHGCNQTKGNYVRLTVDGLSDGDIDNAQVDLGTSDCTAADPASGAAAASN
ncbi:MAG: hypothetical protein R2832_10755 [Rhodothermales bacterium]